MQLRSRADSSAYCAQLWPPTCSNEALHHNTCYEAGRSKQRTHLLHRACGT